MKHIAIILLLLLSSCGGGSAPLDDAAVQALLVQEVEVMRTGIEREDPILASQPVSPLFEMGANVAVRYDETGWTEDDRNGISKFRQFFALVFNKNANIAQELELSSFELLGEVATLTYSSDYSAVRIDRAPPENVSATATDVLVFERSGGEWLLVRWDEAVPASQAQGSNSSAVLGNVLGGTSPKYS